MKYKVITNTTQKISRVSNRFNRGLIAVIILAIGSVLFMQSCKKELQTNLSTEESIMREANENKILRPKVTFKFKGDFHRGAKWSKKQNPPVAPCTENFGVCNVGFEFDVSLANMRIVDNGDNTFRLEFLKDLGNLEGKIFMSENDEFIFPQDVASSMGYTYLEIIPKNYIAHMYENSNLGFVDISCLSSE